MTVISREICTSTVRSTNSRYLYFTISIWCSFILLPMSYFYRFSYLSCGVKTMSPQIWRFWIWLFLGHWRMKCSLWIRVKYIVIKLKTALFSWPQVFLVLTGQRCYTHTHTHVALTEHDALLGAQFWVKYNTHIHVAETSVLLVGLQLELEYFPSVASVLASCLRPTDWFLSNKSKPEQLVSVLKLWLFPTL